LEYALDHAEHDHAAVGGSPEVTAEELALGASLADERPDRIAIADVQGLSSNTKRALQKLGYEYLSDLQGTYFPDLFGKVPFAQGKVLLKRLKEHKVLVQFAGPDWSGDQWHQFVERMIRDGVVTWKEVALAVCGELNPPQVGTAIASNKSFQANYPPRQTMRNVMPWFYNQSGKCTKCGTRMFLEADHIRSKQAFKEAGEDVGRADTLDNMQLLCKRCNVIKRPSHELGGISFAPAQSVLMWIILELKPQTKEEFYTQCRAHGLTMANIRFDEAWAIAEWLKKEGKY
jgi:5-methylcytosine-specific restriction endonuclease McrA